MIPQEIYAQVKQQLLSAFLSREEPRVLSSLPADEKERLTSGKDPFPRALVAEILGEDIDEQDKVHRVLVVVGTWMNSTTGTRWAAGPLEYGPYSRRVGIGVEREEEGSFTPLLAQVEELVANYARGPETLDFLEALLEHDRRRFRRP